MTSLQERAQKIRLLICDVDGVLTDGKIYMADDGELCKAFNVKDGMGITLLQSAGIAMAIITARSSKILERRMQELKVKHIFQGQRNKLVAFENVLETLGLTAQEVAYIGDDLPDRQVMLRVGLAACPQDAVTEIQAIAHYRCHNVGGNGAVREVTDLILSSQNRLQASIEALFPNTPTHA